MKLDKIKVLAPFSSENALPEVLLRRDRFE